MGSLKVLNLLRSGGIGGIEVLCKNISRVADFDNTFCFLFDEGPLYNEMLREGADTISFSAYSQLSFKRLMKLYKLSKKYNIIVLHHNDIYMQFYFILLSWLNSSSRYVMVMHSCFEEKYYFYKSRIKTILRSKILNYAFKRSECNIFVSKAGEESFIGKFRWSEEYSFIVYNGIEEEKLKAGANHFLEYSDYFELLYIGRLTEAKGVNYLIEAMAGLKTQYKVRLTIVGDGEERGKMEALAKEIKSDVVIKFEGFQRNTEKYLKAANLFVYPSIWQEIFGISVVEAMAYGVPCLVNRVGGLIEIVEDGNNGFITDESTTEGIRKGIYRVIQSYNDDSIWKISLAAKSTAARFSVKNTVIGLKKAYMKLLQS